MNLLLKNCKVVSGDKEFLKQIAVVDGKIEKITSNDLNIIPDEKTRVIDVKGNYVLPGLIDPHVHFREPGMEYKEDLFTGSKACAKGGITTFFDMPNTKPPVLSHKDLEDKRKLAGKCITNYGFHFGAADNVDEIKKAANVASTKVFLNLSTGKMMIKDEELLKDIFRNSKFVCTHAEEDMVDKAIRFNKDYGKGLYLCHISLESELKSIRKAKEKKYRIFCEVTPHHLFLSQDDDKDGFTKMKPSLKPKSDQASLWKAIDDGIVDTIGSDHAPHTKEEKMADEPPYGVPGVETTLPLLLDAVNNQRLKLSKVVELCANNPATIFGIKNKGYLREGYDADLVVVDMKLEKEVKEEELLTKCKWSPFRQRWLKGWPVMTIVGGNVVYENDSVKIIIGKEVEFDE